MTVMENSSRSNTIDLSGASAKGSGFRMAKLAHSTGVGSRSLYGQRPTFINDADPAFLSMEKPDVFTQYGPSGLNGGKKIGIFIKTNAA